MTIKKKERFDLKRKRLRVLEIGVIFSLALLILAFKYIPSDNEPIVKEIACSFGGIGKNNFIVCSTPTPSPSAKCPILISLIDDIEFCSTELDLTAAVNYPPPLYDSLEEDQEDGIICNLSNELPEPIGGLAGIHKRLKYPSTAIKNKIEGRVILRAYVNEKGDVYKTDVIRSLSPECNEAAKKAVMDTKFIPGKQRGKPIKVMVAIPIMFKLN